MIAQEVGSYLENKLVRNQQSLREAIEIGNLAEIERMENEIAELQVALEKLRV